MGAPLTGASVDFFSHIIGSEIPSSGGKDATPLARDPVLNRRNQKQTGKLSRSRRLPGRATKKHHSQRSPHQHRHQQHTALRPVSDVPPLHRKSTSLPFLAHSLRSNHDMQGTPLQEDGLAEPTTSDIFAASPRSSMHSASTKAVPHVPGGSSGGECESDHGSVDQEHQVIRRGLEDLLARPPPSFDYMISDDHGSHDRDSPLHRERDIPASGTLPELFLSRAGHRNGGGSEVTPALEETTAKSSLEKQRWGSSTTAGPSRRTKPTRSQSGGHLRSSNSSGVLAFRGRGSASSAGAGRTKHTTAAEPFEGADAVLLEEAFAFAERSAKEEEADRQGSLAPRGCSKLRRERRALGMGLQLHRGENGGRLRRTSSSGGEAAGVGTGGRIEVEDWVRGLPGSSPQGLSQRQLKHQQSTSSINQAPHHHGDLTRGAGREQQPRARRRGKLTVAVRNKEAREGEGTLRFDRRRETEGKKRATATVELVERFETGTGVSALRAELEESQAAMRKSAEAFQQVASQWHQQRFVLPLTGDR